MLVSLIACVDAYACAFMGAFVDFVYVCVLEPIAN